MLNESAGSEAVLRGIKTSRTLGRSDVNIANTSFNVSTKKVLPNGNVQYRTSGYGCRIINEKSRGWVSNKVLNTRSEYLE